MATEVRAAKQALRAAARARIRALDQVARVEESNWIAKKVTSHPKYLAAQRIAVYLSMSDEVRTECIIEDIFARNKECFVPRFNPDGVDMEMYKVASISDIEELPRAKWNIQQPEDIDCRENALADGKGGIDLIVVPGLGFDKNGGRLGRGKGYYDRYVKKCKSIMKASYDKEHYALAVAFSIQEFELIPGDEYDVSVDEVIFGNSLVEQSI